MMLLIPGCGLQWVWFDGVDVGSVLVWPQGRGMKSTLLCWSLGFSMLRIYHMGGIVHETGLLMFGNADKACDGVVWTRLALFACGDIVRG